MAPKGETVITLFEKACKSHGDEECYISYDENMDRRSISFKDLWVLASRFAYQLKQFGVQRGDYVVVATPSSIEYMVANFGIIFAGGVSLPVDKFYAKCELIKATLKLSQAKFLLLTDSSDNDAWPEFESGATKNKNNAPLMDYQDDSLPFLQKIFSMNKTPGKHNAKAFLDHLRSCKNEFRDLELDPEDCCVSPSSLSPGLATPKPIDLSHRSLVNTAKLWRRLSADYGKLFTRFPFYIMACLPFDALIGKPRAFLDTNKNMTMNMAEHTLKVIEMEKISTSMMTPSDAKEIFDFLGDPKKPILKYIITGGQPLTRAIYDITMKLGSHSQMVYASTETSFTAMNMLSPGDSFTPLDCGYPLDGVEIRILDDDFKELPRGTTGRLAIRSPYLFTRYAGQPELSKTVWGEDGWFHTSDAGCLSADGHVHVFGRQGDVISRGIILTYPSWIEKPIMSIPDVLQVMAVPVPDDINFKNICACVVLCPGSKMTDQDIMRLYKESVTGEGAETFHLDHVLIFEGSLPRLSRDKLGDLAAEKLGLKPNME